MYGISCATDNCELLNCRGELGGGNWPGDGYAAVDHNRTLLRIMVRLESRKVAVTSCLV